MNAYIVHKWGEPDQLSLEKVPTPTIAPNEVLIEVKAIGLNPVDYILLSGALENQLQLPTILGNDVAGVVKAVGNTVSTLQNGDEVMGLINFPGTDGTIAGRGFAEFVATPAEQVIKKPKELSFTKAAALPAVSLTAWQALHDVANLQPGQTILIHGASGGVGHMAVQLAHQRGARVIAIARSEQREFVMSLGAERVIDYQHESFDAEVQNLDTVFDTVGGEVLRRSLAVLKPGGMLVTTQWPELESILATAQEKGVIAKAVQVHPDENDLTEIAKCVVSGTLQVTIAKSYPFSQLPMALAQLKARGVRGKLVIEMDKK